MEPVLKDVDNEAALTMGKQGTSVERVDVLVLEVLQENIDELFAATRTGEQ